MKKLFVAMYGHFCRTGDWKAHYQKCKDNGATGVRVFGQIAWPEGRGTWTPFERITTIERIRQFEYLPPRGEDYVMHDGLPCWHRAKWPNVYLPVYDLEVFRPEYFERAQEFIEFCHEIGLEVFWELEDWCSLKHDTPEKYRHAYYVSPQAYSATTTPGGLFGLDPEKGIIRFMVPFWKRALALKPDYVSVMNEFGFAGHKSDGNSPEEWKALSLGWYANAIKVIKGEGPFPLIGSSTHAYVSYPRQIMGLCDNYSVHGCINNDSFERELGDLQRLGLDWRANAHKIIPSGDGGDRGTGIPDFRDRRGITLVEVPEICEQIERYGFPGYEILIRHTYGHAVGTFEEFGDVHNGYAIVREFAKRLNGWTEPIVPPEPPEPPEPPQPPIPPEPPEPPPEQKPCSYWFKRWDFRRWWKCITGKKVNE